MRGSCATRNGSGRLRRRGRGWLAARSPSAIERAPPKTAAENDESVWWGAGAGRTESERRRRAGRARRQLVAAPLASSVFSSWPAPMTVASLRRCSRLLRRFAFACARLGLTRARFARLPLVRRRRPYRVRSPPRSVVFRRSRFPLPSPPFTSPYVDSARARFPAFLARQPTAAAATRRPPLVPSTPPAVCPLRSRRYRRDRGRPNERVRIRWPYRRASFERSAGARSR